MAVAHVSNTQITIFVAKKVTSLLLRLRKLCGTFVSSPITIDYCNPNMQLKTHYKDSQKVNPSLYCMQTKNKSPRVPYKCLPSFSPRSKSFPTFVPPPDSANLQARTPPWDRGTAGTSFPFCKDSKDACLNSEASEDM